MVKSIFYLFKGHSNGLGLGLAVEEIGGGQDLRDLGEGVREVSPGSSSGSMVGFSYTAPQKSVKKCPLKTARNAIILHTFGVQVLKFPL